MDPSTIGATGKMRPQSVGFWKTLGSPWETLLFIIATVSQGPVTSPHPRDRTQGGVFWCMKETCPGPAPALGCGGGQRTLHTCLRRVALTTRTCTHVPVERVRSEQGQCK